ncbi:mechanosensitive ion channel family protein [Candidatus Bathyarchaeota archaeon]|nr:MAG: mechanosensitive ion channel family protein [Candidatus Bathyarchaeota archaeon]
MQRINVYKYLPMVIVNLLFTVRKSIGYSKMVNLAETIQNLIQTNQVTSEMIASIIIFLLAAVIGWLVYYTFSKYLIALMKKTKTTLDDSIHRTLKPVTILIIIIVGLYFSLSTLSFLQVYENQLSEIFSILGILIGAFTLTRITNIIIDWFAKRKSENTNGKNHHILFLLKKIVQLFVYIMAFLMVLWVLDINLSGIVVGLGVGGIAIAFALQSTLSDVFSAFSIYFDRPFEIGDFIIVGDHSGTVTNIGIKSTRLSLLQGEELVISNQELTSSHIRNFRKLERRRITFTIGVTYNTPSSKLKKIPGIIRKIMQDIELAEMDRVHFTEFSDFSLKFLVIYYVRVADYSKYLEVQEAINFAIKEAFEEEAIEMAFPTQTLYFNK